MSVKFRSILFSVLTLFVFVFSLTNPIVARADGELPPTEPAATESAPAVEETEAAPASEQAPAAEPQATEQAPAPAEAPTPEQVSVPQVLEQAPPKTEIVVLDEQGNAEPLASQAAAEIVSNSDPVWCPGNSTPGSTGCTTNQPDVTTLLTLIQNPANASGAGTIYFQTGAYGGAETSVSLDGATYSNLTNLTLVGGWDLGTNTVVTNTTTDFSIPIKITNWNGSVSVVNINIDAGDPLAALYVTNNAGINLTNVDAGGNTTGTGAYLDNCSGSGCTGDVSVTDGAFDDNLHSGLVIDAGGDISLDTVSAQNNGYYGADLGNEDGTGNVQVTDGTFVNNTATGLSIISDGAVGLSAVNASSNNVGTFIDTLGNVDVATSSFNSNSLTGIDVATAGNIEFTTVDASLNGTYGAYLDARGGIGGITITNSTFNQNIQLGLKGMTGDGDINLSLVEVDGNDITNLGAWLKTYEGGNVVIANSQFLNTDQYGLEVVSSGAVSLVNSTFEGNTSHGAAIYSTYSYACFGPMGIDVLVDGGVFQTNSGYGLYVSPGPLGTLTLINNPTFLDNLLGTSFLDLEDHCKECEEEPGEEPKPEEPKLPVNVVELPETDGEPVEQDCVSYSATELDLPAGEMVEVGCPFEGESVTEVVEEGNLPGNIPLGPEFVSALSVELTKDGEPVETLEDTKITISFPIPEGKEGENYYILFWDPTANDGKGGWIELPLAQFGKSMFPLNPDNPDDDRMVSGVEIKDGMVTVTVNFPGIFALVSR